VLVKMGVSSVVMNVVCVNADPRGPDSDVAARSTSGQGESSADELARDPNTRFTVKGGAITTTPREKGSSSCVIHRSALVAPQSRVLADNRRCHRTNAGMRGSGSEVAARLPSPPKIALGASVVSSRSRWRSGFGAF
jgi:hypothetical protein